MSRTADQIIDHEEVRRLRLAGDSLECIAAHFGVSRRAIASICTAHGIPRTRVTGNSSICDDWADYVPGMTDKLVDAIRRYHPERFAA